MTAKHRNHAAVRAAVDAVGGPTKAATALEVSRRTVHRWLDAGHVANAAECVRLAAKSGVPAAVLSGAAKDDDGYVRGKPCR